MAELYSYQPRISTLTDRLIFKSQRKILCLIGDHVEDMVRRRGLLGLDLVGWLGRDGSGCGDYCLTMIADSRSLPPRLTA